MAAFTCIFAGSLSAQIGRRKFLMLINIVAIIGSLLTIINKNMNNLIIGRQLLGIAIGGWTSIGPIYSIELAPAEWRGYAGAFYSWFFGWGVLLSFAMGYGLPSLPLQDPGLTYQYTSEFWRVMLAMIGILNAGHFLLFLFVFKGETYTFTFLKSLSITQQEKKKQFIDQAVNQMSKEFRRHSTIQEVSALQNVVDSLKAQSQKQSLVKAILSERYRYRFFLAVYIALSFNYTGSNPINIYSFNIISEHNSESITKIFMIMLPMCDLIGPVLNFRYLDRCGRKGLIMIGQFVIAISLGLFSIFGWLSYFNPQKFLLILYKLIFAGSTAPVQWLYPSEILPAQQMGIWACCYWLLSSSATFLYPIMSKSTLKQEGTIFTYTLITLLSVVILRFFMVETTGFS